MVKTLGLTPLSQCPTPVATHNLWHNSQKDSEPVSPLLGTQKKYQSQGLRTSPRKLGQIQDQGPGQRTEQCRMQTTD